MNWKRILMGKVTFNWYKWYTWQSFGVEKYWSGRMIYIIITKIVIIIDCRIDVTKDMITGKAE
jgi:hypothetical protein